MKKLLLVAAVAVFAMASCKKDYTCECTFTTTDYENSVGTVVNTTSSSTKTGKKKKDDAKSSCEAPNGTAFVGNNIDGISTTTSCKIK